MFTKPFFRPIVAALALAASGATALATAGQDATKARATFAGGCFWCMVEPFEKLPGVVSVTSGYTGGSRVNPTYEEVSSGTTGHAESIQVVYDSSKITYERLLDVFWHNVDPLTPNAQFCDHGRQYRTAIFFHDEAQRRAAEESKRRVEAELHKTVVTEITPASVFYRAEEYHQDYYKKDPVRYHQYRQGCGRDRRLQELWGAAAGHGQEKP
jgi:peptide-methionine (S)-S-oxide reductase